MKTTTLEKIDDPYFSHEIVVVETRAVKKESPAKRKGAAEAAHAVIERMAQKAGRAGLPQCDCCGGKGRISVAENGVLGTKQCLFCGGSGLK